MPDWNHIVREHLAVLRLLSEREIEIVEEQALHLEAAYEDALAAGLSEAEAEARALRSYDWRLLSHDFLSFGLRIKILISTLLLLSHTSCAIIPIISP